MIREPKIVVVGSLNADLVQRVERFPRSGETVAGSDLSIIPGGKGANQACAAALLGGHVKMIGNVGADAFGSMLIDNLRKAKVDTLEIETCSSSTGTAVILVLPSGENVIVISPGANGTLSANDVATRIESIVPGSILLTQLEIPLETTHLCLKVARERGAVTILDPAPARKLPLELLPLVDYLTPNQTEAALLLGWDHEIASYEEAESAARALKELGRSMVIVKLGPLGMVIAAGDSCERVPGFRVDAIDSTAAGDTFNGALAVALAEGRSIGEAARFANAAGALSVTRAGAQSSIPTRSEVEEFIRERTAG